MGERDQEHQEAARVREGQEGSTQEDARRKIERWLDSGEGAQLVMYYGEEEDTTMSKAVKPVVIEPELVDDSATKAVVVQPDEPVALPDIPPGQEGWVTVALAVVGIAGGGALWKFLTKRGDQKHEAELKRIELEAAKAGAHEVCQQAHKLLETRVDVLSSRIDKLSATLLTVDLDGVDERLTQIEKSLKKRTAK